MNNFWLAAGWKTLILHRNEQNSLAQTLHSTSDVGIISGSDLKRSRLPQVCRLVGCREPSPTREYRIVYVSVLGLSLFGLLEMWIVENTERPGFEKSLRKLRTSWSMPARAQGMGSIQLSHQSHDSAADLGSHEILTTLPAWRWFPRVIPKYSTSSFSRSPFRKSCPIHAIFISSFLQIRQVLLGVGGCYFPDSWYACSIGQVLILGLSFKCCNRNCNPFGRSDWPDRFNRFSQRSRVDQCTDRQSHTIHPPKELRWFRNPIHVRSHLDFILEDRKCFSQLRCSFI